jgi:hypothetical protein
MHAKSTPWPFSVFPSILRPFFSAEPPGIVLRTRARFPHSEKRLEAIRCDNCPKYLGYDARALYKLDGGWLSLSHDPAMTNNLILRWQSHSPNPCPSPLAHSHSHSHHRGPFNILTGLRFCWSRLRVWPGRRVVNEIQTTCLHFILA